MIGKQINHYKILDKLGEGGMGVVYKAEDTKLHRTVALKFLPGHLTEDPTSKQRFLNEARAASGLDHANILTLHEINETDDGQMYITMAYYDGQTLKERLQSGTLGLTEALDIAIEVAKGLSRAHEEGIVHRDIKPANIIITRRNEIKILDFGLAKLTQASPMTQTGTAVGTIAYMSPEQAQGLSLDHRTDIWSLGIVLYEMLTGVTPFAHEYDHAVFYSVIHEKYAPLSEVVSGLPRDLDAVLERALTKKADNRYQSTEELLADLLIERKNLEASETGQATQRIRARRAFSLKWAIPLLALVLLSFVLMFYWPASETTGEKQAVTIAVLPLKGFGEEVSEEWFRDSMTDVLITDLTKIGGLRVISQNSSMQYKDSPKSFPEIADELNVEYITEGSIIKVGDQVRLSVKLVDARANENIWAENFQKPFRDILAVQAEFAQAIAAAMSLTLTSTEQRGFEAVQEVNPEAYSAYLRGRYLSNWSGPQSVLQSFEEFRRAIELAPEFAAAYAGLADAYVTASGQGVLPPGEGLVQAKEAATKALRIDPASSEAYSALAAIGLFLDRDWELTEQYALKAVELNPSNKKALQTYAIYLTAQARHEEAIATIERAVQLDPIDPWTNSLHGLLYYFARGYQEAIRILNNSLETHPNYSITWYWLSAAQTELQQYEQALTSIHRALEIEPDDPNFAFRAHLATLYAYMGQREKALELLKDISGGDAHIVYIALGETDKAFESLEVWFDEQSSVPLFKVAPWYDPIRSDPRFQEILRKAGLAD